MSGVQVAYELANVYISYIVFTLRFSTSALAADTKIKRYSDLMYHRGRQESWLEQRERIRHHGGRIGMERETLCKLVFNFINMQYVINE